MARSIHEVLHDRNYSDPQKNGATERAMREAHEQAKMDHDARQKSAEMISTLIQAGITVPPDVINNMLDLPTERSEEIMAMPTDELNNLADMQRAMQTVTGVDMATTATDHTHMDAISMEELERARDAVNSQRTNPYRDYAQYRQEPVTTVPGTIGSIGQVRDYTQEFVSIDGARNDMNIELGTIIDPMQERLSTIEATELATKTELDALKQEVAGIQEALMLLAQLLEGKQPPREKKGESDG